MGGVSASFQIKSGFACLSRSRGCCGLSLSRMALATSAQVMWRFLAAVICCLVPKPVPLNGQSAPGASRLHFMTPAKAGADHRRPLFTVKDFSGSGTCILCCLHRDG